MLHDFIFYIGIAKTTQFDVKSDKDHWLRFITPRMRTVHIFNTIWKYSK